MEALLAVLIVVAIMVLLIIAIGLIVLIYIVVDVYKRCKNTSTTDYILRNLVPADSIKQLTKTVIDNVNTTLKCGIESQKGTPLLPSCYQTQPKLAHYEYDNDDSGTDDGLFDDEGSSSTLTTTVSNFDEVVSNNNIKPTDKNTSLQNDNELGIMKADKALGQSLKRISSRKNKITHNDDTEVSKPSTKKKKDRKNRASPPSVVPYPPSSLPLSPSTSIDEEGDEPHGTLEAKRRKKTKSEPKFLPSAPRIEPPLVDVPYTYQSLPNKLHPQYTLHASKGNPKRLVSDKPKVKLAIRHTGIAPPSLPQSLNETRPILQLPPQCSFPPMIVISAAQQDSSSGTGPSSPFMAQCTDPTTTNNCTMPLSGNETYMYMYQSLLHRACPLPSLALGSLAESVVRRNEAASIDNDNNEQGQLDLDKFVPNGTTRETIEDENSSDLPSNFPLSGLLQSCVPVQSTCSSVCQSTNSTAWEAQQPIAASNLEPQPSTAELIIAPLTLGVLGELEDEEELVVPPQHDPVQEPPATAASDSGDDC